MRVTEEQKDRETATGSYRKCTLALDDHDKETDGVENERNQKKQIRNDDTEPEGEWLRARWF